MRRSVSKGSRTRTSDMLAVCQRPYRRTAEKHERRGGGGPQRGGNDTLHLQLRRTGPGDVAFLAQVVFDVTRQQGDDRLDADSADQAEATS